MTTSLVQFLSKRGLKVLVWLAVACMGVGALWPGQSLAERGTVVAYGLTTTILGYWFFRLLLAGIAWLGDHFFGRLSYWYILFVLNACVVMVPLAILALPFQWKDLYVDGMTGPMFLASIPAGVGVALAASRVIVDNYFVEAWHLVATDGER